MNIRTQSPFAVVGRKSFKKGAAQMLRRVALLRERERATRGSRRRLALLRLGIEEAIRDLKECMDALQEKHK